MVFRALCDLDGFSRALERAAGKPLPSQILDRLSVLAMLHDMGKANHGFQVKVFDESAPRAGHIQELAPILDNEVFDEELASRFVEVLPRNFANWFGSEENAYNFLLAALSHHGRPVRFQGERGPGFWMALKEWWQPRGQKDPMAGISEIVYWATAAFPAAFEPGGDVIPARPALQHRFAGLLMLADWIGSHPTWFPIRPVSLSERLEHNRQAVPQVIKALGLDANLYRPQLLAVPAGFKGRFGKDPRPLQRAIAELDPDSPGTELIIAESETGSGKTEAALDWFFTLFSAGKVDSLYFALPTRVAARELYDRVVTYISRWFPDPTCRPVTLLAVPGYVKIDGKSVSREPARHVLPAADEANRWFDDETLLRRERTWAAERPKRYLAATVAVGTIDQALLSIVQTSHAHLRSVCLDRSLLVVDEVHASDQYMSRLLSKLLDHHISVGGRAMLLSATLGSSSRHTLIFRRRAEKRPPPSLAEAIAAPYPSITLADGEVRFVGGRSNPKKVVFEEAQVAFALSKLCGLVAQALERGARVIVVLNTVRRAVKFLREMETDPRINSSTLFTCNGVIAPHHGRFAPSDREALDAAVSQRFGPGSECGPVVIVGTQTLEQSLDIDADFMISDLAPADVLLQRVGRLHRHQRPRPPGYDAPARCVVITPPETLEAALDDRGEVLPQYREIGYGSVYEDLRMLELTRKTLLTGEPVEIPTDNRRIVEAVTHPDCLAALNSNRWNRHAQIVEGMGQAKAVTASFVTVAYDVPFDSVVFHESEGRVSTRLGLDQLHLRVSKPFTSPFGQVIESIVIPGHLAPPDAPDVVEVEAADSNAATLRLGDRRYSYGRYGLEVIE